MADSNRTQMQRYTEDSWGVAPGSIAATLARMTGENFKYNVQYQRSEEITSDRLTSDTVPVDSGTTGGFNFELSYGAQDEELESLFYSTWQKIAEITNSASDTEITQVTDSSDTFTVASGGASFKAGHLVRASGFTNAANNLLFRVASSTGTTVVGSSLSLTDEAAPPLGAQLKVVGFQGASGDITATSTGLGSTTLDFTTLGLVVGQWIKVSEVSGYGFATAALNAWMRITAIAANALTLDNRPSGWTTDSGTSKTIRVYVGDYLRSGTTLKSFGYEKVVTNQTTPVYRVFSGQIADKMSLDINSGARITGRFDFMGKTETDSASSVDASPTAAPTNTIMTGVQNVGRVAENGAVLSGGNYAKQLTINVANNLRKRQQLSDSLAGAQLEPGVGDFDVTGSLGTYFADDTLYAKYLAGTATSLNSRVNDGTHAIVITLPKVKFEDVPDANSAGRNQDVMATMNFRALKDTALTNTALQLDRFSEYA